MYKECCTFRTLLMFAAIIAFLYRLFADGAHCSSFMLLQWRTSLAPLLLGLVGVGSLHTMLTGFFLESVLTACFPRPHWDHCRFLHDFPPTPNCFTDCYRVFCMCFFSFFSPFLAFSYFPPFSPSLPFLFFLLYWHTWLYKLLAHSPLIQRLL